MGGRAVRCFFNVSWGDGGVGISVHVLFFGGGRDAASFELWYDGRDWRGGSWGR